MLEAFDAVIKKMATHLAKQRSRAVGEDSGCRYRAEDGSMCAVGCLIPDELYSEAIEFSISRLFAQAVVKDERIFTADLTYPESVAVTKHLMGLIPGVSYDVVLKFLRSVQNYHDSAFTGTSGVPDNPRDLPSYADDLIDIAPDELETRMVALFTKMAEEAINVQVPTSAA